MDFHDDSPLFTSDAMMVVVAFILCVECAKIPEYRCENCDKVYKQESRYNAHIAFCVGSDIFGASGGGGGGGHAKMDIVAPSVADFSELLRQNREMMEMMRKQQETIQLLVAQLVPVSKMNIESSS